MKVFCLLFLSGITGCGPLRVDPAGEARTRRGLTDSQIAGLSEPLRLDELERKFGAAESQPGPRVTYRAADHSGQFFWVHVSSVAGSSSESVWKVDRIVRADRLEEGGIVVWPPRLAADG